MIDIKQLEDGEITIIKNSLEGYKEEVKKLIKKALDLKLNERADDLKKTLIAIEITQGKVNRSEDGE